MESGDLCEVNKRLVASGGRRDDVFTFSILPSRTSTSNSISTCSTVSAVSVTLLFCKKVCTCY